MHVVNRLKELDSVESIQARKVETISKCLFQYGSGLKSLEIQIDVRFEVDFTNAFGVLGRTLESLSFDVLAKDKLLNVPHFNISTLAVLCPHVKRLRVDGLSNSDRLRSEIECLYYSYGEKLKFIGLSGGESMEFIQKVRFSCPSAVFDCYGNVSPVNVLSTLGAAIRSFSWLPIVSSTRDMDFPVLSSASAKCVNVEGMLLSNNGITGDDSKPSSLMFFHAPKPKLRKMILCSSLNNGSDISNVVAAVAMNTGALEEVNFVGGYIQADVLQKLACANPQLEILSFILASNPAASAAS